VFVGLSLGTIAMLAAPVAAVWAILGIRVAAKGDVKAAEMESEKVTTPVA
jgi:hypothetical protein